MLIVHKINALEPAVKTSELLLGEFITREANEAAEVKRDKPILVVLGNPPLQRTLRQPQLCRGAARPSADAPANANSPHGSANSSKTTSRWTGNRWRRRTPSGCRTTM
jgi:hypothetical protein